MIPKDAIEIAKTFILEHYENEGVVQVGLEEIEYDEAADQWRVTVGFSRLWSPTARLAAQMSGNPLAGRSQKIVTISAKDGSVVSMKNRETESA